MGLQHKICKILSEFLSGNCFVKNSVKSSDKLVCGVFGIFSKLVCMTVPLYSSSNLVCLANERVWYWCGLESLIIGFYVYHLGCDSWYACYAINLVK